MERPLGPIIASLVLLATACSPGGEYKSRPHVEHGDRPVEIPALEDNIRHDTLLIQTTFDMGDGTYVMVAGNVEPTFEGIRLYRYELLPDSNARILAFSSAGYESWTMLPTFFAIKDPPGTHLILANFGERESWGQKLIYMDSAYTDLGFLDLAFPERVVESDTSYLKRTNIAPYGRLAMHLDTAVLTFECDSAFLYDDMDGHHDTMVAGHTIRYTYHPDTGLELWVEGRRRPVKQPG